MTSPRRTLTLLALTAIAAAAPATAAFADDDASLAGAPTTTAASQQECADPVLTQPFAAYGDTRDYVLAPGGEFDDAAGAGWTFDGGAHIETVAQRDGTQGGALVLPSGSTAVSATMCVDLNYPTARAWARNLGRGGNVRVSVVYPDAASGWTALGSGGKLGVKGADWAPSADIQLNPERGGADSGWRRVAFVFSARGDFQVDGFYVDPRMIR